MGKGKNTPASAGVTSKEVVETPVFAPEVVQEPLVVVKNKLEVIPSNVFIAEDGTEVEFAVQHFIYNKKKYTVEEAVAEVPEALQELFERKSFIFKKV